MIGLTCLNHVVSSCILECGDSLIGCVVKRYLDEDDSWVSVADSLLLEVFLLGL